MILSRILLNFLIYTNVLNLFLSSFISYVVHEKVNYSDLCILQINSFKKVLNSKLDKGGTGEVEVLVPKPQESLHLQHTLFFQIAIYKIS